MDEKKTGDLFDVPDTEILSYTDCDRKGQGFASTMAQMRKDKKFIPVVIGDNIIKISGDHASKLLTHMMNGFQFGKSWRTSLEEMIDKVCDHR
jgi:hypothetical protein